MAKKATHRGTCQCCGREQKLPGGVLSKHGYTTEWGFFEGTCTGAGRLPLEKDRSWLDATVENLRAEADVLEKAEPKTIICPTTEDYGYQGRRRVRIAGDVSNDFEAFRALILETKPRWGRTPGFQCVSNLSESRLEEVIRDQYERAVKRAKSANDSAARHYRYHALALVGLAGSVHGTELKEI